MSNIGKKTLIPDTQLTFTCFFKKRVLAAKLSYYELQGVSNRNISVCVCALSIPKFKS